MITIIVRAQYIYRPKGLRNNEYEEIN